MVSIVQQTLIFASRNLDKLAEYRQLLSQLPVVIREASQEEGCGEVAESAESLSQNAWLKARSAAQFFHLPAFADDSGLEVYALGGAPGVHSRRFAGALATDRENVSKLLHDLKNISFAKRGARFRTVICLTVPRIGGGFRDHYFEGKCEGIIAMEPLGGYGFGYDPVFYIPHMGMTLAQMDMYLKNTLSHRKQAAEKMMLFLEEHLPFALPKYVL